MPVFTKMDSTTFNLTYFYDTSTCETVSAFYMMVCMYAKVNALITKYNCFTEIESRQNISFQSQQDH